MTKRLLWPFAPLLPALVAACDDSDSGDAAVDPGPQYAVIVKAAGYLPDGKAPDDPDAISSATTATYNTHVYAERLAEVLAARVESAEVADYLDCAELACLAVPDQGSTATIVVFAGPVHWGVFPDQLSELAPLAAELEPLPRVVSAMSSYETAGQYAVETLLEELAGSGLSTVEGAWLDAGDITEEELDSTLESFAERLVGVD